MKKFSIAWVSYFDNVMHVEECYANSYRDALILILSDKLGVKNAGTLLVDHTEEDLHMFAFDMDCCIQALQTYGD